MINATNKTPILTDRNKIAENNLFEALTHQKDKKKPENPKGYLLERNNVFKNVAQDVAYFGKDVKNAGKAIITGKSNDHAIGKINDLGLKIGALGIASYLALKRGTAKQKAMEFIGGGTFLATMALWPKFTVTKPMEKKFGFNIQQDYVDSQGRRKKFFGDNQYLPWDLWSKEKINKVADHMGIPKDLPDREEFTKRKMQKVALQGNTWILLTSGFATPLITALICRAAENPVEKFLINKNIKKAANKVENLNASVDKLVASKTFDAFNKQDFLKALEGFKEKMADPISLRELTKYLDPVEELSKDKNRSAHVIEAGLNGATHDLATNLFKTFESTYDKNALAKMKDILPPEKFNEFSKFVKDNKGSNSTIINMKILDMLKEQGYRNRKIEKVIDEIKNTKDYEGSYNKLLKALRMDKANKGAKTIYDLQRTKRAEVRIISDLADAIAGNHKESLYTQVGEEFSNEFIRQINPDHKAIKEFTQNSDYAQMLHESFEKLATNVGSQRHTGQSGAVEGTRGTLEYFVKNVSSSIKKLDTEYDKFFERDGNLVAEKLLRNVAAPDDKVAKTLDSATEGFINRITKRVRLQKLIKQGEGAKLIIAADAERRLSLVKNDPEALRRAFKFAPDEVVSDEKMNRILRTVNEYLYDRTALAKYLKNSETQYVSTKAIQFIYDAPMDEKVASELAQNGTKEIVERARKIFGLNVKMDPDFARSFLYNRAIEPIQNNTPEEKWAKTDEMRRAYRLVKDALDGVFDIHPKYCLDRYQGDSLVNRFKTITQDRSISQKWLKTFGIAAIVLTAVTVGAIKFFGKTDKEQELYTKKGVENAKNKQ